jgi:hypothetical protein
MEYEYIIEVTLPSNGEIYYLALHNDLTKNPQCARRFRKNSEEVEYKLNHLSRDLNPRLVDRRQIIGTYISTYDGKYTFDKITDRICQNNVLAVLMFPILLPIALIIRLRYETIKLFAKLSDKYVTNNR